VRAPPDPFDLECELETWEAARPIIRVHHSAFGATEFNPGKGEGRFHPIVDRGMAVPTLYGSSTFLGAVSETLFRAIPVAGPERNIRPEALLPMVACTLLPRRTLRLIQLREAGLERLGVTRAELIESKSEEYAVTRAWATALHAAVPDADGLLWMSRQHSASEAVMLFGTRVERSELSVGAPPRSLFTGGDGWRDVVAAAEAAGIMIIER
jgi:hypothetical protein